MNECFGVVELDFNNMKRVSCTRMLEPQCIFSVLIMDLLLLLLTVLVMEQTIID